MKKYLFYKTKIEDFRDVAETLRVIEKSAGAHIHFLKKKVAVLSEYKKQITIMLNRLSRFYWDSNHPLINEWQACENALLVVTGERGIVGGLYHQLINEVIKQKSAYERIWVVGSKGRDYLREENIQIEEMFTNFSLEDLPDARQIQKMNAILFKEFQDGAFKKIDILYPRFLSFVIQRPAIVQFLPFDFASVDTKIMPDKQDGLPIFEPSKKLVFEELMKKYIGVFFTEIIFEAKLSEFAARTVTAENAIKETERLIGLFTRNFLKEKHFAISQKQVESFSVHKII